MRATLARLADTAIDRLVLPGYTAVGYRARQALFDWPAPDLTGRRVLVTGAGSGIGEATCAGLQAGGAEVHMLVRSPEKGEQARRRVAAVAPGGTPPRLHLCDLSDLASVREFAERFTESGAGLDALIHNAGVMPERRTRTAQGFELAFATNLLGPFLLTELLLPVLRRGQDPVVIFVSSGGMYLSRYHRSEAQDRGTDLERDFSGTRAYARTKRGAVMLAQEWRRRPSGSGIRFEAMHPGWVATPGVAGSLPGFNRLMGPLLRDADQGADTVIWLAGRGDGEGDAAGIWHDRRLRPAHRLPGTRESDAERAGLFDDLSGYLESSG